MIISAFLILVASPMIALVAFAVFRASYGLNGGRMDRAPGVASVSPPTGRRGTTVPLRIGSSVKSGSAPQAKPTLKLSGGNSASRASVKNDGAQATAMTGARLVGLSGTCKGRSFPIPATGVTIGRSQQSAEIVLGNPCISSSHAWIGFYSGQPMVRDLDSSNGTYLNGRAVSHAGGAVLHSGDRVVLAGGRGERLLFEMEDASSAGEENRGNSSSETVGAAR
jgi:hypothetical protein